MTVSRPMDRRRFLALGAASGAALLTGCAARAAENDPQRVRQVGPQVDDVRGPFDWRRCAGTEVRVLLTAHQYTDALQEDLADFRRLTGMTVRTTVLPESTYFDQVSTELVSGTSNVDVFMVGAYMVWQYGPPGWMEDLDPWLDNRSATAADYEVDDILPTLQDALRWSFVLGEPVGRGGRWAMPWGWETNVLAYDKTLLDRLRLSPPETLDQLDDVARESAAALRPRGGYGLAVRGTESWATVHPGFMTQYTREGHQDFSLADGVLSPSMSTSGSIRFHRQWTDMIRAAGSPQWDEATYQVCASDLGNGRAAMVYDATSITVAQNRPGASPRAGRLAWHPGPAGPNGDLSTNLWVWSLAMNARSVRKPAAWLFMQWATGRGHLRRAALNDHTDPVRASILDDPAYRRAMSVHENYLETVEAVRDQTKVQFTPQPYFFDATTRWSEALRDMHGGADPEASLTALAERLRAHG